MNYEDTYELTFEAPITFAKVEYASIKLTQPSVKDLRASSKAGNALDQGAALIAFNAKVPPGVVDLMCQRDFERASDFFAHFRIDSGPPDPEPSTS